MMQVPLQINTSPLAQANVTKTMMNSSSTMRAVYYIIYTCSVSDSVYVYIIYIYLDVYLIYTLYYICYTILYDLYVYPLFNVLS